MALETGNYIANLVAANPPGTDPKSQGDDHLRLTKNALLNCFPGFTGSIMLTGADGGAANAYTLTSTPALLAYSTRMIAVFSPTADNTGASTLNVSGLGAKDLKSVSGAALLSGELITGIVYAAFYNGTEFRLLSITKGYADQLAFQSALPAQVLGFLISSGTVASWSTTFTGFAVNEVKGADIASAATINLTTATGNLIHITGNSGPITGITIPIGAERTLIFDSNPILTHSASLLLPTVANIQVAAGDRVKVRGDTAGANVVSYQRADGRPLKTAALELLASVVPSVAANVDFLNTFSSLYDHYLVVITGLLPSADAALNIRVANAGAADAGSNYLQGFDQAGTTYTTTATQFTTSVTILSSGRGINAYLYVRNANATTRLKSVRLEAEFQTTAGPGYANLIIGGVYQASNAVSGVRLFWSGGANFQAVGSVRVYGLANT